MALTQALHRKQAPAKRAMPSNAGCRIPRTRRFKATDWTKYRQKQLRQRQLVDANQNEEEFGQHDVTSCSTGRVASLGAHVAGCKRSSRFICAVSSNLGQGAPVVRLPPPASEAVKPLQGFPLRARAAKASQRPNERSPRHRHAKGTRTSSAGKTREPAVWPDFAAQPHPSCARQQYPTGSHPRPNAVQAR
jgi:hypothetical protein